MAKLPNLLFLGAACAAAQTVEGSVFDAATGAPIAGVKVQLEKGTLPYYSATTDDKGVFRIDKVSEDDYAIRYQSPGYWLTAGSSDYRLYHISAGTPLRLDARLMPWSRISRRVVDTRGNSVANAQMELTGSGLMINGRTYLRTSWGSGGGGALSEGPLAMTFRGTTDVSGKFEVQVMPGSYGLAAVPPPDLKAPEPGENGLTLAWTRTYYPGVTVADAASKIVVLPGSEVSGIELKLPAIPTHAVRGVVLNADGTPAPKVKITLGARLPAILAESKPDGTFEFPVVPEGEWRFTAEAPRGAVRLRATEWIEVGKHDVENVRLRLVPPVALLVSAAVQATKGAPPPRLGPITLALRGGQTHTEDDLGPGGVALASLDGQGDRMVENAYPGWYRMGPIFSQPAPPYYLDAILVGGADLATQDVEISMDAGITVVYKSDGGSVRGRVEDCALGGVVLVSSDPAHRQPAFSRSAACDSKGNYAVDAVRPGDYYALAFAGNGPVLKFDEALLNQAEKISIRSGEAATADLKTITRPVY